MPIDTHVTLPPNDTRVRGLRPLDKKTLFDMYTAKGARAPIYVVGEGQTIEDTRDVLMRYNGEPFGLNLVVEEYMYHWDWTDGIYLTVSVKGE